jgi:hypothetical protein
MLTCLFFVDKWKTHLTMAEALSQLLFTVATRASANAQLSRSIVPLATCGELLLTSTFYLFNYTLFGV